MRTIKDLVVDHDLFGDLDPAYVDLLAGCGQNVVFPAGTTIARVDDPADSFYLVRQGRVALQLPVPHRRSAVVETLEPGEVVGWSWIVPPYRWPTDVLAVEQTRAVAFDGACVRNKCEADHALGHALMRRFVGLMDAQLRASRVRLLDLYGDGRAR